MNQQQIIHNHSSVSLVSPDSSPSSSSSLLPSSSTIPPSASPRSLESLSSPSSLESFSYNFTSADQWKKHHIIGRGGSSTVYKVELKQCGNILAMKEVQIDGLTKDQILAIEAEIETMKSLSNPNIVNYLGTFRHQNNFFMFLEYADGGSIRQFYQKNGRLDESQVCLCTKDMLYGLLYLHSNGIAHRDIKGANVLLTAKGEMKLADFGASKRLDTASIVSGLKGTPHWMAPEVIKGTQNSTGWIKADIWSLGCTVVEMITGALPFSEYANPMTAMYHIAGGKSPPISADLIVSSSLREFVSLCCAVEPNDRPTVEQLLQHPFILQCSDNRESMYCKSTDIPEKVNSKIENTGSSSSSPSIPSLSSSSLSEISESRGQTSVDSEGSKTTVRVSEGQMVLQKLNRVVVIDTHTNSDQLASNESTLSQNQVTPVIHQTRKRRSSSNPAALQTLTTSRSSPLLPPTGKKNDKKNSLKPLSPSSSNSSSTSTSNSGLNSNSGSGSNPHAASPSSIIRGIPSVEDTERTTPSNRIDSSACPTPIMFSNNLRDVVSSASPSTTDLIDDKKNSVFGPCSLSNDLSEFQIPITISQELTPPPLSRSASLNDAIFDKKEGVLRPVAPLSGQKINICCDVEPKEVTPTKFIKKQPLQTLEKSKDSKSIKIITKPKSNSRSKSASVASSPNPNQMKIILPPMQSLSEGLNSTQLKSCQGQAVPELPLRLVQSAPCFTQSMTLPPLLSTSSPKRKSNYQPLENLAMTASCPSKLSNRKLLNHSQRRPSFEEYEQEGGILAPRR